MEHMQEIHGLLKKAYATELAADCCPEKETDICGFEERHQVKLPADYRWLLLNFGAFQFGEEPFLYALSDLGYEYPMFLETYSDYQENYPDLPSDLEPFPIGVFGEGSIAFLNRKDGKVFMLIHDCNDDVPLQEIAPSFFELVKTRAEGIVSWSENNGGQS